MTELHRDLSVEEWGFWRQISRSRPIGTEGIERLLVMLVQMLSKIVGGRVPPAAPRAQVIAPWLFAAALDAGPKETEAEQSLRLLRIARQVAEAEEEHGG